MPTTLKTSCPKCGATYQVSEDRIGQKVKCSKCQHKWVFDVEDPEGDTYHFKEDTEDEFGTVVEQEVPPPTTNRGKPAAPPFRSEEPEDKLDTVVEQEVPPPITNRGKAAPPSLPSEVPEDRLASGKYRYLRWYVRMVKSFALILFIPWAGILIGAAVLCFKNNQPQPAMAAIAVAILSFFAILPALAIADLFSAVADIAEKP
jgi:predicted Zn finger-like uncharacterized protein